MSRRRVLLALDAGTTGVRAIAFDERGAPCGSAYRELGISCPQPGWVETDPLALWQSARTVAAEALRAAGAAAADVISLGIASQRATTIVWEKKSGSPVYPAIVWQDVRTAPRVAALVEQGQFASTMMSSTKIEWILEHVEDGRQRAGRGELCFGTVETWLAWKATGGQLHATDPSNASCTGLYDFGGGDWDPFALGVFDLDPNLLPRLVPSCGKHAMTDADACGFAAPVGALAGDQQASMFGLLRHQRGDFKVTFGTSAMVDVNTGPMPVLSRHGAYPLVLWEIGDERLFCLEGSAITAGAAVQWLRDGLGVITSAADTASLAEQVDDSGGVWVVPAFQGLGTPYMDTDARALVGGLSRASTKAHVVRAVLEGIAWRCREIVEALAADVESAPTLLRADGGAAENAFLIQHLANVLGIPVETPSTVQGTALGAALMAGVGTGLWSDVADISQFWRPGSVFEPRWKEDRREQEYELWRRHIALARPRGEHLIG